MKTRQAVQLTLTPGIDVPLPSVRLCVISSPLTQMGGVTQERDLWGGENSGKNSRAREFESSQCESCPKNQKSVKAMCIILTRLVTGMSAPTFSVWYYYSSLDGWCLLIPNCLSDSSSRNHHKGEHWPAESNHSSGYQVNPGLVWCLGGKADPSRPNFRLLTCSVGTQVSRYPSHSGGTNTYHLLESKLASYATSPSQGSGNFSNEMFFYVPFHEH